MSLQPGTFEYLERELQLSMIPKRRAMRDSNYGAQKPLYIEATLERGTSRVAQGVARMQLSQVVALLIERWDELDNHSRGEILRKLE